MSTRQRLAVVPSYFHCYTPVMHVFAYGTLMFPEVWQAVVGRGFPTIAASAPGYEIYRVAKAVYPGIVAAAETSSVPGIVYLDVDEESLARLDWFEDDFYKRQSIGVVCAEGERRMADTYVVPPHQKQFLTKEPWTRTSFLSSGGLERFLRGFLGFQQVTDAEQQ